MEQLVEGTRASYLPNMAASTRKSVASRDLPIFPRQVHFLGICGRMVGGLALALRKLGVRVSGTDPFQFPPMPEILRVAGLRVNQAWSARHLPAGTDAVVTGSLIFRGGEKGNPELEAALNRGLPVWNSTAFLEHYFLRSSQNFVVAGTKGKTTTTSMLAWILETAGLSPDCMIGGQVRGKLPRVRLTGARLMVLEGDEYRCGLGDPLPKFLRYHPRHLLVTNVSHDHLEMYPTCALYRDAFVHLVNQVAGKGSLTLNADDAGAMSLAGHTPTPVQSVGFSRKADRRITGFRETRDGTTFYLGGVSFRLALPGRMNALDAALAAVVARQAGIFLRQSARALRTFPGVEGRFEIVGRAGRTVIYADEAYHPIAVRPLLAAARKRHPRRRLVFIFEPRYTGGRLGTIQKELPEALAEADVVMVSPAVEVMPFDRPFDRKLLCRDLRKRGVEAVAFAKIDELVDQAPLHCRDGDIIIISFSLIRSELTERLTTALKLAFAPTGQGS